MSLQQYRRQKMFDEGRTQIYDTTERFSAEKLIEKFWAQVNKTDTCWLWQGALNKAGYGRFRARRENWFAHRFSYVITFGTIPNDLVLDHLCEVKNCVNPKHLEAVSLELNIRRAVHNKRLRSEYSMWKKVG